MAASTKMEVLNLKVEGMDINNDHHNDHHYLPFSDDYHEEDCQMPLIDDDSDLDSDLDDSEDEYEDVWDPHPRKREPKRQVYEVEAKLERDGRVVKFPINYSSTTEVGDIKNQAAQLLGLQPHTFSMTYVDAGQYLIWLHTRENLVDALCTVDESSQSESAESGSNVLRLGIILTVDRPLLVRLALQPTQLH